MNSPRKSILCSAASKSSTPQTRTINKKKKVTFEKNLPQHARSPVFARKLKAAREMLKQQKIQRQLQTFFQELSEVHDKELGIFNIISGPSTSKNINL
eukprot:Pgem_evm1s706